MIGFPKKSDQHSDIKEVPPSKDKKRAGEKETEKPVDQSIDG